jgi:eukaryotic-like serine/threonine-protein kinase
MRDHSSGISASVEPPVSRRLRLTRPGLVAAAVGVAALAVLAYLAGARVQARRDREAPPPKRTTLTFRRGYLTGARFAPDGHTIVYSACWDGKRSEIFTTRVGSIESRPLGIKNAGILAVSSTGEMAISIGEMLARVPLAGGAPREILGGLIFAADWSPDGKDLAVAEGFSIQYPIGKVLHVAESSGFVSSLRVSPDGNLVAFLDHPSRDSERGILTVVDRAGKKRVLTNEGAKAGPILWSPAGDEVFFTRWGGAERRGARLSGGTQSAAWVPGLDDVSRDGRFLDTGMLSENYRGVILARVPDSPEERNLSWLGRSVAVDLSADGKQLLLYEEGSNLERQEEVFTTYLRPTDGSDALRLGDGRALALSPDRRWALVARASPETHLVLLPVGEGKPRRLPGGGLLYRRAVFFPDGRRILYNAEDQQMTTHTYIQDVEGGPPRQVGKEGMYGTLVSPDGRTVSMWTYEGVSFYPADGEEPPRPIRGALGTDIPWGWSADGKTIYLWAHEEEPLAFYRLDLATGRRERWKQLAPPDMTGFLRYGGGIAGPGLTITPDGRYYAYTYFTDQSRLALTDAGPDWWK